MIYKYRGYSYKLIAGFNPHEIDYMIKVGRPWSWYFRRALVLKSKRISSTRKVEYKRLRIARRVCRCEGYDCGTDRPEEFIMKVHSQIREYLDDRFEQVLKANKQIEEAFKVRKLANARNTDFLSKLMEGE